MNKNAWTALSGASFFPAAAILHHAVFFRPTCILNPTGLPDYSLHALRVIATTDPSLICGFAIAVAIYVLGLRYQSVQKAVPGLLLGLLPLTLWIWDIPGTDRWICRHFHDGRTFIRTRHLYELALAAFAACVLMLRDQRR